MKKAYKYYIIMSINLILLLICWGFIFYYQYNLQQSQIKIFKFITYFCFGLVTILPISIIIMLIRFLLNKMPQFHRFILILITMFILFINYNIIKLDKSGYIEDGEFLIINKELNNDNYYIDVINRYNNYYTYHIICSSKQYKKSYINNVYHISYISREKFGKRLILIEKLGKQTNPD